MKARNIFIVLLLCSTVVLFSSCAQRKLNRKHNYMSRTYLDLKKALNGAEVTIINDSVKVLFPNDVLFEFGRAGVLPKFFPVVSSFAKVLNDYKKTGILIVGHTDSVGEDLANMVLSTQRADSARTLLMADGISAGRLNAWGLGERLPIASNATEEGRARNRRVEFIVLYRYRNTDVKKD